MPKDKLTISPARSGSGSVIPSRRGIVLLKDRNALMEKVREAISKSFRIDLSRLIGEGTAPMVEDSVKERLKLRDHRNSACRRGDFPLPEPDLLSPYGSLFLFLYLFKVKEIHNWMGIVGAYLSGLLFQGFGFPSFLIPLSSASLPSVSSSGGSGNTFPLKLAGWVVILIGTSSFFGLWLKPLAFYQQDLLMGGFIGEIFSRNSCPVFQPSREQPSFLVMF